MVVMEKKITHFKMAILFLNILLTPLFTYSILKSRVLTYKDSEGTMNHSSKKQYNAGSFMKSE